MRLDERHLASHLDGRLMHKGNKQSLPSKPCAVCGRPMSWRKAWAKNWEQVRYCSDACRKAKTAKPAEKAADAG